MENVPSSAVLAIIVITATSILLLFVGAATGAFGNMQIASNKKASDASNAISREVLEEYEGRYVTGTQILDLIAQLQDTKGNQTGVRVEFPKNGTTQVVDYLYSYTQSTQNMAKVAEADVAKAREDFAKYKDTVFSGRLLHMYANDESSEIMMVVFGQTDASDIIDSDTSRVRYSVTIRGGKGTIPNAVSLSESSEGSYKYAYNEVVKVTVPSDAIRAGYSFDSWKCSERSLKSQSGSELISSNKIKTQSFSFKMPKKSITLTLQASLNRYEIKYVDEYGNAVTVQGNPNSYTVEDGLITLNNPKSSDGNVFRGWRDISNGTNDEEPVQTMTIPAGSVGNKKFEAVFSKKLYYVKFHGNGATGGSMGTQTFSYNESKPLTKNAFTKTNYRFVGWSTTPSASAATYADGQTLTNPGSASTSDTLELYAIWARSDIYTVSYNTNQGTMKINGAAMPQTPAPSAVTSVKTLKAGTEVGTLEKPTRKGFTFVGWYTNTSGADAYKSDGNTQVTSDYKMPKSDMVLYAHWKPITYRITYNLDGGEYTSEVPHNFPPTTYNATTTSFALPGAKEDTGSSNISLDKDSAYMEFINSYSTDDSTNSTNKNTSASGSTKSDIVYYPAPVKEGYEFAGWIGTECGTATETVIIYSGSTGDREYTATWKPKTYTVTFNPMNGIQESQFVTEDVKYRETVTELPTYKKTYEDTVKNADGTTSTVEKKFTTADGTVVPKYTYKAGYVFQGWWTTNDTTGEKLTAETVITKDTTFYAHYVKAWSYTVKFHGNGATSGSMESVTYTYGVQGQLPANKFEKTGYTFVGWTTRYNHAANDPSYVVTLKDKDMVINLSEERNGIVDLYALWTPSSTTLDKDKGSATVEVSGYYLIEAWGAQGGGNGGLGGYSRVVVRLNADDILYASVGTQGTYVTSPDKAKAQQLLKDDTSGANGGGKPSSLYTKVFNGKTLYEYLTGGGATSVSLEKGTLDTLAKDKLVLVAGGGAASYGDVTGGDGGGETGKDGQ